MKRSPWLLLVPAALLVTGVCYLRARRPPVVFGPALELKGGEHIVLQYDSAPPGSDAAAFREALRLDPQHEGARFAIEGPASGP